MSNHGTGKLGPDELTSIEDFPVVPAGPAQGVPARDAVDEFMRPEWITHETKAARPRGGEGEIVRDRSRAHVCATPTGRWERGTVWCCDCGRRWTVRYGPYRWARRYWPWPR